MDYLTEEQKFDIEVVGHVLPFKVSNYVIDQLIDWTNFEKDPFFILTFPQKGMLKTEYFKQVADLLKDGAHPNELKAAVDHIRRELNPHPANQEANVPELCGLKLRGLQHKYRETLLFFPNQGQTCHAFCTFCFRWPQFTLHDLKFALKETGLMIDYLREHPEITDILITGGDPAVMKTHHFEIYINTILDAGLKNIQTIRIGTKALTYWPYRFTTDPDAPGLLALFKKVTSKGINLSIMAHFNHPNALKTPAVREAVANLLSVGVQIRSQSPLLRNINDDPNVWAQMWRLQVNMRIIPYYMFIARDTGAQDYFAVKLEKAWHIFREAYMQVSGICRTVRGPSMSCEPGKVRIIGLTEIHGEKVFVLNMIQGRNPDWTNRPFFARYNPDAIWISDLKPAFGEEKFFFQE